MGPVKKYLYESYLDEGLGVSFKGRGHVWNTAEDVAPVVQAMNECRNMKYLELEGNTLGVEAAKEIGKALESHPELEIALWKDLFTTRDKSEIPKALDFLFAGVDLAGAHIQRLDLSDNAVGPMGMPGVTPFFRTSSSFYLEELIVNNEGMGPEGGSIFASALTECFELSQASGERVLQLKVFQCGRNRQENKGTICWAKLFGQLGTLEEVQMPQNGINPPGIQALAEAFLKNPNLRVINLEDNTVRHDGTGLLANVLPNLVKLEELNLSDCLIKNTGADHLASALRHLQQLRSLQLVANEIKSGGGMMLASVLRELPCLTYVNLSGNEFGMHAVSDIEHLLENVTEVIIEDDEGEGDDGDEEDENKENENSDEADENWEPELTADKTRSGSQSVISPPTAVSITTNQTEVKVGLKEYDPASLFIANPSIETYMKLLPKPAVTLAQYFRSQNTHEFHDLCIFAALSMSKIHGPNMMDNMKHLFDEALKSTNSNAFATSLLICLGFIRSEKAESSTSLICKPTEKTIQALTQYLRTGGVPVTVFNCIHLFVSQQISPTVNSFHTLNSEYQNLLGVIRTRMDGITLY